MNKKKVHHHLEELAKIYWGDKKSLSSAELDLLCMYHQQVRDDVSKDWSKQLKVDSCIHYGHYIEIPALPSKEKALRIKKILAEKGIVNTRTFIPLDKSDGYTVIANKHLWYRIGSDTSRNLFERINADTDVQPLWVYSYAGQTYIDLATVDDAQTLIPYLAANVIRKSQDIIITKDDKQSIDITRVQIIDKNTGGVMKA